MQRSRPRRTVRPRRNGLARRVADWVHQHFADRITIKGIAAALQRHPAYLGTMFHQAMGVSVHEYVRQVRMRHAAHLLAAGDKIEAVSLCTGYRSKTQFFRHFKQHFGMTPAAYRDSHRRPRRP